LSSLSLPLVSSQHQNRDLCDTSGKSWFYLETIDYLSRKRVISSSSCPNHFSTCQEAVCGGDITTKAIRTDFYYEIPLYPILATEISDLTCLNGTIGIALNGVAIQSMSYEKGQCVSPVISGASSEEVRDSRACDLNGQRDGIRVCGDAVQEDYRTFDRCGGHANSDGVYHYHIPPACLLQQLSTSTVSVSAPSADTSTMDDDHPMASAVENHSPQIGWSLDGFPIYGPIGPLGIPMLPCTSPSSSVDDLYCLDECNGLYASLDGIDQYLYRYYLTGPVASEKCQADDQCEKVEGGCCADAIPSIEHRPYTLGCYRGCRLPLADVDGQPTCLSNGIKAVTDEFYPTLSTHPKEIYTPPAPSLSPPTSSPSPSLAPTPPSPSPSSLPDIRMQSYRGFGSTIVRYDPIKRNIGRIGVNKSSAEVTVEVYETGGREAFITGLASLRNLVSEEDELKELSLDSPPVQLTHLLPHQTPHLHRPKGDLFRLCGWHRSFPSSL
jgi:hypothetical protein